eukprot:scaffold5121_cov223-Ochromonas_danica.AAC.18
MFPPDTTHTNTWGGDTVGWLGETGSGIRSVTVGPSKELQAQSATDARHHTCVRNEKHAKETRLITDYGSKSSPVKVINNKKAVNENTTVDIM